jgi:hypothetical protein
MALVLISPPAVEPVTISELKNFLKVDPGDDTQDDVIATLAMAARSWCEGFTGRRFVQQTWQLLMDFFPGYIDLKIAGAKVSSPFVSGSNAVLVGIRYAVLLPYPPCQSLVSFIYQNANGQLTSMITGPTNIGGVTNTEGAPIGINTTEPHGLQSGASVVIAGNSPLLALLDGQAGQVITVTDANDFLLNGSIGTGSSIPAVGSATGFNFVADLASNPGRLTPVFGQMWPVARVVVNAVAITFVSGYAIPVTVSMDGTTGNITATGYTWQATDIGRPISVPGAGMNGMTLNTAIASITSGTVAVARNKSSTGVSDVTALLVNAPSANPSHWEMFKAGIKLLVAHWYENRVPDESNIPMSVKAVLWPTRDLRF